MEVNVTLVLQIILFMCAYYFLYNFLFVPAYKILDENEQFKNKLYHNLEQEQQVKDALLQAYYVKNSAFKGMLISAIPEQSTQPVHQKTTLSSISYCFEEMHFSEEDRKKTESFLVDHLSQVIKK